MKDDKLQPSEECIQAILDFLYLGIKPPIKDVLDFTDEELKEFLGDFE